MPVSNALASYIDVRAAMDRALASEKGVILTLATKGDSYRTMMRCYKCRSMDRGLSQKTFTQDDPRYGTSAYDSLWLERKDNLLYIHKVDPDGLQIEDIQG